MLFGALKGLHNFGFFEWIGYLIFMTLFTTIGWFLGDIFRRFVMPDAYFTSGIGDAFKKKIFWMVGPQIIGWLIGVMATDHIMNKPEPISFQNQYSTLDQSQREIHLPIPVPKAEKAITEPISSHELTSVETPTSRISTDNQTHPISDTQNDSDQDASAKTTDSSSVNPLPSGSPTNLKDETYDVLNQKTNVQLSAEKSQQTNDTYQNTPDNNGVPIPKHVIGDTYVTEVLDVVDFKKGNTTERHLISADTSKIVVQSKSLSGKKGTIRNLEYTPEWNLISTTNPDGESLEYTPPLKYFEFPLYPGKEWAQTSIETNSKTANKRSFTLRAKVGEWETVTVPAGTFNAIKIIISTELLDQASGFKSTGTDISWYVPELRKSVKSETFSQKQDGSEDKQVIQLVKYIIEN